MDEVLSELKFDFSCVTMDRKSVGRILNDLYTMSEISGQFDWKEMPYTIEYDIRPPQFWQYPGKLAHSQEIRGWGDPPSD